MDKLVPLRNKQNDHEKRIRRQETKPVMLTIGGVYAQFLAVPMLRGFWPMTSVDEYGAALDLSGQGRVLYYNGNPTYNLLSEVTPYIDFDGTGDYLSRPAEFGLTVTGAETYVASTRRGFTVGGWFKPDAAIAATQGFITQQNGTIIGSAFDLYLSDIAGGSDGVFNVYSGPATIAQGRVDVTAPDAWHFYVGVLDITAQNAYLYVDSEVNTNGTVITSMNPSLADFCIGGYSGGSMLLAGQAALCFCCAAALPAAMIAQLYSTSRGLFGV